MAWMKKKECITGFESLLGLLCIMTCDAHLPLMYTMTHDDARPLMLQSNSPFAALSSRTLAAGYSLSSCSFP